MRSHLALPASLLLAACAALSGCTAANTTHAVPFQTPPLPAGNYANWQFQNGDSLTSRSIILLSGPVQIAGGTVTAQLMSSATCSSTKARSFSGTLDATTGVLSFATTTPGITGQFTLASATSGTGTLAGGAIADGTGATCLTLVGPTPSIAVEIPTLSGTYKGTLSNSTGASATATLTLTQSTTPDTNAGFPLTASLQLASGSCAVSDSLSGSISGANYTLSSATASGATISGLDANNGQTLPAISVVIPSGSCGAGTFTGTLTLQ